MTIVERKGKINIQISIDPFLLFVLTSVLIHGIGLLILVLSNRALPAARQETESTPIDFVLVPPFFCSMYIMILEAIISKEALHKIPIYIKLFKI